MNQRGLFDPHPVALAREQGPTVQIETSISHAPAHPALRPDVERVIVHPSGKPDFVIAITDGRCTEVEFWTVQTIDGRYFRQFVSDGRREPHKTATDQGVAEMIANGTRREVRG